MLSPLVFQHHLICFSKNPRYRIWNGSGLPIVGKASVYTCIVFIDIYNTCMRVYINIHTYLFDGLSDGYYCGFVLNLSSRGLESLPPCLILTLISMGVSTIWRYPLHVVGHSEIMKITSSDHTMRRFHVDVTHLSEIRVPKCET